MASNIRRCLSCCGQMLEKGKSFITHLLFVIHGTVTVWRVTDVYLHPLLYLMFIPIGFMIAEFFISNCCVDLEWKWFTPSVFLYLISVVPGLWLLQFKIFKERLAYKHENDLEECGYYRLNETGLREIKGVSIPLELSSDEWALALEQVLLILLILGRWLLPKGALTRDQLSQLLLVYIGIAADSLEFSLETLKEQAVLCNLCLIVIILAIWSWSLLQFCLVMTGGSAAPKQSVTGKKEGALCGGCCESDIWALMMSVVLQDAPYLTMRLYLMTRYRVINQMMLFFTCKNMMVVLLQFYRMAVLCFDEEDDEYHYEMSADFIEIETEDEEDREK